MPDYIKIPDKPKLYQAAKTDNVEAVVGGKNCENFAPSVNVSFKMGSGREQYFFNICDYIDQVKTVGKQEDWQNNKLAIRDGDVESTFELHDYSLKIERVFHTKPTEAPKYKLAYTEGVSFHYQPELTPEEIAEGCERPDNVVGSYAVYCDKQGHYKDKSGKTIVNYGCGKIGHLYAPYWTDASDKKIKGTQEIVGNILAFALPPQEWIDSAALPIKLDPDVGYTTVGGSSVDVDDGIIRTSGLGSPSSSGDVDSISIYRQLYLSASVGLKVGLYLDNSGPSTKVGTEEQKNDSDDNTTKWQTYPITGTMSVTDSNSYWVGVQVSDRYVMYYDSLAGTNRYYDNETWLDAWPSTYSKDSNSGAKYSFYFTYTADSGVLPKELLLKFDIHNSISKNLIGKFNIFNTVSKTETFKFDVLNTVSKNFIGKFDVRNAVAKELIAKFDILSGAVSVSKNLVAKFDINNSLSKELVAKYDVHNILSKESILKFDIQNSVAKEIIAKFDIRNLTNQELIAVYDMGGTVSKEIICVFDIQNIGGGSGMLYIGGKKPAIRTTNGTLRIGR